MVTSRRKPTEALSPIVRREIALQLLMSEKTLKRVLTGAKVKAASRERVRRALEARGLLHLLPEAAEGAR